ncbi:MAG: DUF3299 domain-containing protein [Deltaproteobacteria bacterium]|jgi:hypothetical protein|nr:DUF3299 domain-containing protein [Deltaproteobacteria bacterium]
MMTDIKCAAFIAVCGLFWLFLPAAGTAASAAYREVRWEELVPQSWHPEKIFDKLDIDNLSDGDPRAEKALETFMAEWAKAPVNEGMNGQRIKIPGFIAPLDWENDEELKEFLLVPYFGACIHVPPPPANQIIYVKLEKPLKGIRSMDAIWAYGTITVERTDSGSMGASGYRVQLDKVEPYKQ